jgi:hypothetical protein
MGKHSQQFELLYHRELSANHHANVILGVHASTHLLGSEVGPSCALLTGKRCPDRGEVMVAVPDRMILKDELARERSIAVERYGRGAI